MTIEAEKGAKTDISLECVILGSDGKTLAHVNDKEPSMHDGAFEIFGRKETVPIQLSGGEGGAAEGDAPPADGDAPPTEEPPAEPPAEPAAEGGDGEPSDENQPPKPKPAEWEAIPDRLHLDISAVPAEYSALVVNLVSKTNFLRAYSATVRLFIGHVELGRATFPLRVSCLLLFVFLFSSVCRANMQLTPRCISLAIC